MNATGSLSVRLAEAGPEELVELVEHHLAELDHAAARQAIKNPYVTREVIDLVGSNKGLLSSRELRREVAAHRQTSEVTALRLVSTLFWRDLVALGVDAKVRPTVRRAADRALAGRVASLTVGERMAIARRGGPGVVARLRHDADRRVIAALLDNPRLTEGVLAPLLASDTARPVALETIIDHPRWGRRYSVRAQFCRNPKAPVARVLQEMAMLRKIDLRKMTSDPRLPSAVRRRAQLLVGHSDGASSRSRRRI